MSHHEDEGRPLWARVFAAALVLLLAFGSLAVLLAGAVWGLGSGRWYGLAVAGVCVWLMYGWAGAFVDGVQRAKNAQE